MSHARQTAQLVKQLKDTNRNEFIPLSGYHGRPTGAVQPSVYGGEARIDALAKWAADMTAHMNKEQKIRAEEIALLHERLDRDAKASAERIDKEKQLRNEQADRILGLLGDQVKESQHANVHRFARIEKDHGESVRRLDLLNKRQGADHDNIARLINRTTALENLDFEKLIDKRLETAKGEMAARHAQVEQKLVQQIAELGAQLRAEQDRRAQQEATANQTNVQSELQIFVAHYEKVAQIKFEKCRSAVLRDFNALLDESRIDIERDFNASLEKWEAGMRRDRDAALAEARRLASAAATSASTASTAAASAVSAATKTQPQTPPEPAKQGDTTPPDSVAGGRKRRATAVGGMHKKSKY